MVRHPDPADQREPVRMARRRRVAVRPHLRRDGPRRSDRRTRRTGGCPMASRRWHRTIRANEEAVARTSVCARLSPVMTSRARSARFAQLAQAVAYPRVDYLWRTRRASPLVPITGTDRRPDRESLGTTGRSRQRPSAAPRYRSAEGPPGCMRAPPASTRPDNARGDRISADAIPIDPFIVCPEFTLRRAGCGR